jgi:hypothetical protein
MTNNTLDIINKLIEAKKLEKDALMMMLPENTKKHLEVIGKEVKEMILECVSDLEKETEINDCSNQKKEEQNKDNSNVKKVNID